METELSEKTSTLVSKRCPRCKEWKPRGGFYGNRSRYDGLDGYCKTCRELYREALGYYADLEQERYHRIQDEACCHNPLRRFYPAYRFLKSLETAEVVEIKL